MALSTGVLCLVIRKVPWEVMRMRAEQVWVLRARSTSAQRTVRCSPEEGGGCESPAGIRRDVTVGKL